MSSSSDVFEELTGRVEGLLLEHSRRKLGVTEQGIATN